MQTNEGEAAARVNPAMITLARESRGLTQIELASRLSMDQGWLSKVEAGLRPPQDEALARIAGTLDYPIEFFYQNAAVYGLGVGQLFHRMRSGVSSRHMHMFCAQLNLVRMHLECLLKAIDFGEINIPSMELGDYGDPATVARSVRAQWRLPAGPLMNLTEVIEREGGIIIPFDFGVTKIDALSLNVPAVPPLFFVSVNVPGDRLRFSLAHELGHIVMHQRDPNPEMEKQADQFAAEFLMPQRDIRGSLVDVTLDRLAAQKLRWKVSMAALLKRAEDLSTITKSQARSLWIGMSRLGYRTREPDSIDIPRETPSTYNEIIRVYKRDLNYSAIEMSKMLMRSEHDVHQMFYSEYGGLRAIK